MLQIYSSVNSTLAVKRKKSAGRYDSDQCLIRINEKLAQVTMKNISDTDTVVDQRKNLM